MTIIKAGTKVTVNHRDRGEFEGIVMYNTNAKEPVIPVKHEYVVKNVLYEDCVPCVVKDCQIYIHD